MTPTGPQKLHEPLKVANTPQWRELLVTLNPKAVEENIEGEPEFKLTKATASTPNSLVILSLSALDFFPWEGFLWHQFQIIIQFVIYID